MERRGEAEGQTGGNMDETESLCMNPHQRLQWLGYSRGWLGEGLKGDGLFANCGHFWPEHDRFNGYFNMLLNTTETWNANVEEDNIIDICFQPTSSEGSECRN